MVGGKGEKSTTKNGVQLCLRGEGYGYWNGRNWQSGGIGPHKGLNAIARWQSFRHLCRIPIKHKTPPFIVLFPHNIHL